MKSPIRKILSGNSKYYPVKADGVLTDVLNDVLKLFTDIGEIEYIYFLLISEKNFCHGSLSLLEHFNTLKALNTFCENNVFRHTEYLEK